MMNSYMPFHLTVGFAVPTTPTIPYSYIYKAMIKGTLYRAIHFFSIFLLFSSNLMLQQLQWGWVDRTLLRIHVELVNGQSITWAISFWIPKNELPGSIKLNFPAGRKIPYRPTMLRMLRVACDGVSCKCTSSQWLEKILSVITQLKGTTFLQAIPMSQGY